VKRFPRQKISICKRPSICFRCWSNWPHKLARRSVSTGSNSRL